MSNSAKTTAFTAVCYSFLCALFFGLPLVLNQGYFNISATKSLYFLVIDGFFGAVAIVFFVALIIRSHRLPISFTALDCTIVAIGIANVISAVLSPFYLDVWIGRQSRLQGAAVILIYVLIYIAISNGLSKGDISNFPIRCLVFCFVLVTSLAILHSIGVDPSEMFANLEPTQRHLFISTIGNINFYSAFVCLCLPTFIVLSSFAQSKASKVCWAVALILSGAASVLTCSESFVVGMVAFAAVAPFFFFKNAERLIRFCVSLLTVLLSATAFYYIYVRLPHPIYSPSTLLSHFLAEPWAWLAIFVIAFVCFLTYRFPTSLRVIRWTLLATIIVTVIIIIIFVCYANSHSNVVNNPFLTFNDRWGSGRGKIYRLCVEIMQDFSWKEWLFGVGPESLQNVMADRGITYIDQAHNEYLQTLMTTGVFGLAAQLSSIALIVVAAVRYAKHSPIALSLFMGLVAYWAQATVNIAQSFTTPLVYAFIAIIGATNKYYVFKKLNKGENKQ